MNNITVLKIGGEVLNSPDELARALDYFAGLSTAKILVHGGGKSASHLMERMGMEPKMINGRRITDAAGLEVVTMVYAGLLNKQLVAQLQSRDVNAIGLSGADANLIKAHQRPVKDIDYGFAGDIDSVDIHRINQLLTSGLVPIICPITHNQRGQLLNTNADTIASEVARSLVTLDKAVSLRFCFTLPGVMGNLEDPNSLIPKITPANYPTLIERGVIAGGIRPKLDNAFAAVRAGVAEVVIGDLAQLQRGGGTTVSQK